jgi:hypothetical protein
MNKRGGSSAGASSPCDELRHFTNPDDEKAVFRRYLDAPSHAPLPLLMFYGVGGVGKTWLGKELRAMPRRKGIGVPTARLDLDPSPGVGGAVYHQDGARALADIRRNCYPCCVTWVARTNWASCRFWCRNLSEEGLSLAGAACPVWSPHNTSDAANTLLGVQDADRTATHP